VFTTEPREMVRLYWHQNKPRPWEFDDPPQTSDPELAIRPGQIRGLYSLFSEPPHHDPQLCVVDSGAMLTLIPREIWSPHKSKIRWLHTTDAPLNSTKVSGHSLSFRLGLVTICFLDYHQNQLSRRTIAGCVKRTNALKLMVLGMGGGQAILSGGLCVNGAEDSMWLVTM
jgi:hypothetical protein